MSQPGSPYDGDDRDDLGDRDYRLEDGDEADPGGGRRGCGLFGCVAVLVAIAVLVGGGYLVLTRGVEELQSRLGGPADFSGPGTGRVLVEVRQGDTGADIATTLKDKGVVKSVAAFTEAFEANEQATRIQVGFYELQREMRAADAIELLVDAENRIRTRVTIPEGLRLVDIVDVLVEQTDFSRRQYLRVLRDPARLGLPGYVELNDDGLPEGYLFPATYEYPPRSTPESILRAMVNRWKQAAADADLEARADQLGYSPHELMTIASLVEAEARGRDMAKVARVIYNRLENYGTAGTVGRLEIDATVGYALGERPGVALTREQLETPSDYNTRINEGLPPGPIDSPGATAIEAATSPADGDWYYYVTVNLRTGKTKFAETYDEFLRYRDELERYCTTSDAC